MVKKLSLRPAAKTQEQEMQDFVSQANDDPTVKEGNEPRPWENPRVRDDVIKMVSLRMPEPYILRLQYISEKTHISQQELLRQVLLPWLEQEAEKY